MAHRAGTRPCETEASQELPPYLVLLRVGFALPAALLRRRCALTAPFHPYLSLAARAVCFLWHFPSNDPAHKSAGALPDVIRHTALRSSDFPLAGGWRVLSLHVFGCEEECVCQQGQADQQRNQSGEIDRLVVHQPMQKRHDADADDGGDQSA